MFSYIYRLLLRIKAFRHLVLEGPHANVIFSGGVEFHMDEGSRIVVKNGTLKVGFHLGGIPPYASYHRTIIAVGKNATLLVGGNVSIAPGASIKVRDGGLLEFSGQNTFAHNLTIICDRSVKFDKGTRVSWNATFIDDDGHCLEDRNGRKFRGLPRPLYVGKNVGIQMHVQIPRGISIGHNSIVSSGTVLRRSICAETLVYQNPNLKIKSGLRMSSAGRLNGSRSSL